MNSNHCRSKFHHRLACLAFGIVGSPLIAFLTYECLATQPVITLQKLSGTQYSITITNAANTNYTLMWTPSLGDANYPWQVITNGSLGQTNFTVDAGVWPIGFFQILTGDDTDLDSFPTWMDADPLNSAIGALTITISSPTNGASFQ